jgi:hypothetical protein
MEHNANLLQLRALQSLSDLPGNTLVLGVPNGPVPLTKQNLKTEAFPRNPEVKE